MDARTRTARGWAVAAAALAALAAPAAAQDDEAAPRPLLWELSGPGLSAPSWVFGSLRLPDARTADLPPAAAVAIDRADVVFTELDPEALDAETLRVLVHTAEGEPPAAARLERALLERLEAHLRRHEIFRAERVRLWFVCELLLRFRPSAEPALDRRPHARQVEIHARLDGKDRGVLAPERHRLSAYLGLEPAAQVDLLRAVLDGVEASERSFNERLVRAYAAGDAAAVAELRAVAAPPAVEALRERWAALEGELAAAIVEESRAAPGESCFFEVEVLRLVGETGVLARLREAGLTVRRVGGADDVARPDAGR